MTKRGRQGARNFDPEVMLIGKILRLLERHDLDRQQRVIQYLHDRLSAGRPAEPAPQEKPPATPVDPAPATSADPSTTPKHQRSNGLHGGS